MRYKDCKINFPDENVNVKNMFLGAEHLVENYTGPRNVAVDIGAHVGTKSIYLATDGGFKKIYALEMHPVNFAFLCQNILLNNLQEIITPVLGAIGRNYSLNPMYSGETNSGQQSLVFDSKEIKPFAFTITCPFDVFLYNFKHNIDFLKIDIEGMEYIIFKDCLPYSNLKKVRYLFLERHGPNPDFFSDDFFVNNGFDPRNPQEKLIQNLEACGFKNIKTNDAGQIMAYNEDYKPR